jgi:hypothetical protein
MPCRSDYLEQNPSEAKAQRAAKLLLWLDNALNDFGPDCGFLTVAERNKFKKQDTYYAQHVGQTQRLCKEVQALKDAGSLDDILKEYFKDPLARDLADWVDEHEEQDRVNEQVEALRVRNEKEQEVLEFVQSLPNDKLDRIIEVLQQVK